MYDEFHWVGWEYETANGLHMYQSKRHIQKPDGTLACGTIVDSRVGVSSSCGEGACGRCTRIAEKVGSPRAWKSEESFL